MMYFVYRQGYVPVSKHYLATSVSSLFCASGTLDLVARSGDFFVGVLYRVGVGSDLPCRESPAQIGRFGNYVYTILTAVPSDPISATINSSGGNVAGSTFTLTCTVSEDITGLVAMPTAIWLNPDGEPVMPGNDITIATPPPSDRVAITTLTFNPLRTSHNRGYTCSGTITSPAQEGTIAVSERGDVSIQSK